MNARADYSIEKFTLACRDRFPLAVTEYKPLQARYRIVINGATGVSQRYYKRFAEYAASRGAWVTTYDYRGVGDSRTERWDGAEIQMSHWGEIDLASILDSFDESLPVSLVGHSVGGQIPGLADNVSKVRAMLCVAAQCGYYRLWPIKYQLKLAFIWFFFVPLVTRIFRKLPGWAINGESIPSGVALEWARWCRTPNFISTPSGEALRPHFQNLNAPSRFLAISDDYSFAPISAVTELARYYTASVSEIKIINPSDFGLLAMGHFGFFSKYAPVDLWRIQLDWLENSLL